jgi:hypothetical protein
LYARNVGKFNPTRYNREKSREKSHEKFVMRAGISIGRLNATAALPPASLKR